MSKPFISVIMPVFKAEPYVSKAIESVRNQTFSDFELILIDDCSPDNSGEICENYAKEDNRIKVYHNENNMGASKSRNFALTKATGDYIFFMDSDDYIDTDLFSNVMSSLKKNDAEVVLFGLIEEYYDKNNNLHHSTNMQYTEKQINSQRAIRKEIIYLEEKTLFGYACNKMFKRDYLSDSNVIYPERIILEDFVFNVDVFQNVASMNILSGAPYHYSKRIDYSVTSGFIPDYYDLHKDRVETMYNLYESWGLLDGDVKRILSGIYIRYILSAIQRNNDKRAGMKPSERKAFVKLVFSCELYNNLIGYFKPKSLTTRFIGVFFKKKATTACLFFGKLAYIIKNKLPILFSVIKQKR